MKSTIQKENGFTLIEVLLTIIFVSILIVSVLSLFTGNIKRQSFISKKNQAMSAAKSDIEQIIATKKEMGYSFLTPTTKTIDGLKHTVVIDSLESDIKKIVVTVEWSEGIDSIVTLSGNYE